ncbi:MAG: ATP-dependent Clp protease adaptor ClpS [Bacteroidetes bacterium]|nr:ATP-dependent Clp protease adaptor ClpS [Bacteroidota bacterium]
MPAYTPYILEETSLAADVASQWAIVLYNDEVNTFDWVIECLIHYCGHDALQAEQCAWLVHTKGKYAVKTGDLEEMIPVCSALCDQGLSARLEQ